MQILRLRSFLVVLFCMIAAAPATQPATPEALVGMYLQAVRDQDTQAVRSLYYTRTPEQEEVAGSLSEGEILRQQLRAAWGEPEPGRDRMTPGFGHGTTWRIDRDKAMIDDDPQARHWSPALIRVGGAWKIDLADYSRFCEWDNPAQCAAVIKLLKGGDAILRSVLKDSANKRFASLQEATDEVARRTRELGNDLNRHAQEKPTTRATSTTTPAK